MFVFGVQPSQELWEKKPESLSVASAASAWQTGFADGAGSTTHAIFQDEVTPAGVQLFYDDGYERGERERKVADQINNRHGDASDESIGVEADQKSKETEEPEEKSGTPHSGIEIHVELDQRTMMRDCALVASAVSLAAIAAALWYGETRRT